MSKRNPYAVGRISPCPTCGYKMDSATPVLGSHAIPAPGDFSVCLKCGEAMVFTHTLRLRLADLNDMQKLSTANSHLLDAAQKLIRKTRPLDPK